MEFGRMICAKSDESAKSPSSKASGPKKLRAKCAESFMQKNIGSFSRTLGATGARKVSQRFQRLKLFRRF
jgi:hypothetical protein